MNDPKSFRSRELQKLILHDIEASSLSRITFADYMDLVLYHPQYGYYNSQDNIIGASGDFFTSSSLGKDFGELLAIQFREMWQYLAKPNPFYLVEIGAGRGNLSYDILAYLQNNTELIKALKYIIIEQSQELRARQQKLLEQFTNIDISWKAWQEIPDNSLNGCLFSNELIDAFPVHLITLNRDEIQEIYLTIEDDKLAEIVGKISTDKLEKYFDLIEIDWRTKKYPQNYRTEVNLKALDWLKTVSSKLRQGYLLTIDYGYTAEKYYHPQRSQGTLQCYYQHRHHNNPYVNLGYQDITAHVNFTALERQGELSGLETIGFTRQGMLLMALGLGDRLNELSSGKYNISQIFQRRDALHQLIEPTGLGGFGVLIQGKNLTETQKSLTGLSTY